MEERNCPVCNIDLVTDEVYDDFIGINYREEEWFGHCPQYGQKYRWIETYSYKETKNFETYIEEET